MTTDVFFIFGLAILTRICNPSTDSETSLSGTGCFYKKPIMKRSGNVLKTGTIVFLDMRWNVMETQYGFNKFMMNFLETFLSSSYVIYYGHDLLTL